MQAIYPTLNGIQVGTMVSQLYREENSNRAGHHYHLLTAATQGAELIVTADHIAAATGLSEEVGLIHYLFCLIVPAATAWAVSQQIENFALRHTVLLIHDNIGFVCQIANIVASIALIYFGQVWYGGAALATIGLGILDQMGILPQEMRQFTRDFLFVLGNATGLLTGGAVLKFVSLLELVKTFGPLYLAYLMPDPPYDYGPYSVEPATIPNLSARTTRPNQGHILYPLPFDIPSPDVDLRQIVAAADTIAWTTEPHAAALHAKLGRDDRVQELGQDELSDVDLFKQQLRSCVASITDRQILQGEPRDYQTLTRLLRHITAHLQRETISEAEKADILLRLGIDGGDYCGPAKFRVVEEIFIRNVLALAPNLAMRSKIAILLNQEREVILQSIIHTVLTQTSQNSETFRQYFELVRPYDTHNYNGILNLIGRQFGIVSLAAENDALADPPVLMTALYAYLIQNGGFADLYWEQYNSERIIDHIRDSVGTPYLPRTAIYAWWQNWVEQNERLTQEEKVEWQAFLEQGGLDEGVSIQRTYLAAMLLELGFLRPH